MSKGKSGRPKGSKGKRTTQVFDVKTPCPHCGKTDTSVIFTYKSVEYNQVINGIEYNTLAKRIVKCNSCGLNHVKRTNENR